MFITRINKMFHKHGRIAFGVLTIVIIIPFVLYFSATPDDILNMFFLGGSNSNVSMYGETLSREKLDQNTTNAMIAMTLQGYQLNFETARDQQQILQEALNRIRLLTVANKRGIMVDDMQVASYIRSIPLFQEKGVFNLKNYDMFVQYILGKYRLGDEDVENVARENLIIDILRKQIIDSVVATDAGAREFYNASNESYNVKVATFDSSDYLNSVQVNEEELEKYFNSNRNKYLIPAKYKADVVRFNFINFDKEAAEKVADKQVDSYYLQNKNLYKKIAEKDAKEKIKKELIDKERNKLAKNKAQKFAVDVFKLIEQSSGKKPALVFENFALRNKFKVHRIKDWIDAETELIPRLGKLSELVKAITLLYIDQPITNAVLDKNAYFVACLTGREAARRAKYSEVKEKVKKDFVNEKALELARASAEAVSTEAASALKDKKSLPAEIKFKSFPVFTPANPMSVIKEKNGYLVFQKAMQTKERTVSSVADTPNGAIIVYVDEITLPTNKEFEKQIAVNLANYKKVVQQTAWSNFLLMLEQNSNTVIKVPAKGKNS
jgi:peptidyl-prolyl cis-trans isomerase D